MGEHQLVIPPAYTPLLDIRQTEKAIKLIKDTFQAALAENLSLCRVSAPLFVDTNSGLNDNLNGIERPVAFDIPDARADVEIVHSLAKWKRLALKRYAFAPGEGLYTDMDAIRRDEELDNLHSVYVDQWDWEKIITAQQRTENFLQQTVRQIVKALHITQEKLQQQYPQMKNFLSQDVYFISSQELEDLYPDMSPKERENAICREKGMVFISQIGGRLKSGQKHDGRAPDYDDWALNGDILVFYPVLDRAVEISSMGIRVDEEALLRQLKEAGCEERKELAFHKMLLQGELPLTIGGGIGQSRLCMLLLHKAHVGEVQASVWPDSMVRACAEHGIALL